VIPATDVRETCDGLVVALIVLVMTSSVSSLVASDDRCDDVIVTRGFTDVKAISDVVEVLSVSTGGVVVRGSPGVALARTTPRDARRCHELGVVGRLWIGSLAFSFIHSFIFPVSK